MSGRRVPGPYGQRNGPGPTGSEVREARVVPPRDLLAELETSLLGREPQRPEPDPDRDGWWSRWLSSAARRELVGADGSLLAQGGPRLSDVVVLNFGILASIVMAVAAAAVGAPLAVVAVAAGAVLVAILQRPDLATPVFLFVMYLNLPVIATQFHGVPQVLAAGAVLVLLAPVGYHVIIRQEPIVATAALGAIGAFLLAMLISTLLSVDASASFQRVAIFVTEGLVIYLLVSNAIRTTSVLRQAMWAVLLAGAVMGGLSVWQEVTGSYANQLGGLAQVNSVGFDVGGDLQPRLSGPIGEKNRYAQVLIVLLPIGVYLVLHERRRALRAVAMASTLFVLAGMLLSFSRGGFIALVALVLVAALLRYIRPLHVVGAVLAAALVVGLVAPSYTTRVASILDVAALFDETSSEPDGAILGRTTSNLAALNVFSQHPVFGVGPGQYYTEFSFDAGNELGLRRFDTERRAHNLYLEIAADLGLVGLIAFLGVVGATLLSLWRARARWIRTRPEIADMASAMWFAVLAYMFSAVFLHLSYERYFWVLMAIAASTAWILGRPSLIEEDDRTEARDLAR